MGLRRRDVLETALFDSEQIVTIGYLSRHADISIDEAKEELHSFYKENKGKADLHAVYLVSGEMIEEPCEGDQLCQKPAKYHRVQLVREMNLESIKRNYRSVDTCEIFCLHSKPIKSLYAVYDVDSLDDDEFLRTDQERSWINCPVAEIKRAEMLKEHREGAKLLEEVAKKAEHMSHMMPVSKPSTSKSITQRSAEKNDISALFARAATRSKQVSPKKTSHKNPFNTLRSAEKAMEEENANATENLKRRGRKILVDNEDKEDEKGSLEELKKQKNESLPMQSSIDINNKCSDSKKKLEESSKKIGTKHSIALSQEDLFSDGGSSPEKMDVTENEDDKRINATPSPKKLRRSPRNLSQSDTVKEECESHKTDNTMSNKKPTRKEYVTETFVDDDGFMVTKQVLKEVDVQSTEQENAQHSNAQKALMACRMQNVVSTDKPNERTRAASKRTPHGQCKISAFFKKQ